ncbi:MAG: hypothetical protein MdMp014T_2423 [Treponematales bacterium]
MTDADVQRFCENWKNKYSGFTPAEKQDFCNRVEKCKSEVLSVLQNAPGGLKGSAIQSQITDGDTGLVLPFALDELEGDGTISASLSSATWKGFPFIDKTYCL